MVLVVLRVLLMLLILLMQLMRLMLLVVHEAWAQGAQLLHEVARVMKGAW